MGGSSGGGTSKHHTENRYGQPRMMPDETRLYGTKEEHEDYARQLGDWENQRRFHVGVGRAADSDRDYQYQRAFPSPHQTFRWSDETMEAFKSGTPRSQLEAQAKRTMDRPGTPSAEGLAARQIIQSGQGGAGMASTTGMSLEDAIRRLTNRSNRRASAEMEELAEAMGDG